MNADIGQYGDLRILEEFRDFDGIDPIALWKDATFGMKNFNKLTYVAVVAESGWVQTIARAIDHLLPAKVKVFEPDQIDAARQWLRTAPEPNQESGIEYKSNPTNNIVEITIAGKITESDFDRIMPQLTADLKKYGKLKVLEEVRRFEGMDPMAYWKDLQQVSIVKDIIHVAIVADAQWLRTLADAMGSVLAADVRGFERSQIEAAREWLRSA